MQQSSHGPDDLTLISVFVRVARCMSFSGAAAELQVSLGTVSRQIARLEKKWASNSWSEAPARSP
jgi:DNA-binding MarR family transcriptional regulator